jgi:uncharacterized protein YoxC
MSQDKIDKDLAKKVSDLDHKMDMMADILDRVADRLIDIDTAVQQLKDDERKMIEELKNFSTKDTNDR